MTRHLRFDIPSSYRPCNQNVARGVGVHVNEAGGLGVVDSSHDMVCTWFEGVAHSCKSDKVANGFDSEQYEGTL